MKTSTVSMSLFFLCSMTFVCASDKGSQSSLENNSKDFHSVALDSEGSGSINLSGPVPQFIVAEDKQNISHNDSSNSYWTCLAYISACVTYCCGEQDDLVNGYSRYHDNP